MSNREYLIAPWIRLWHWTNAALIMTLGTAAIAKGFAFMITQGVAFVGRWPVGFTGLARGAAYHGYVARQGRGVRIRGGTAQSYYVGVESNMPAIPGMEPPISALCLAPFGMEEGTEVALDAQEFGLVVGQPVRLRFFGSSMRRQDAVGSVLDFWGPEELVELQQIEAQLPAEGRTPGEVVAVQLLARVTDIGTLELLAVPVGGSERWKVEFDVRAQAEEA